MQTRFKRFEEMIIAIKDLGFICSAVDLSQKVGISTEEARDFLDSLSNSLAHEGQTHLEKNSDEIYVYPKGEQSFLILLQSAHYLSHMEQAELNAIKNDAVRGVIDSLEKPKIVSYGITKANKGVER